jgi:hypothetical protein
MKDKAFKSRLVANPATILKEAGMVVPEGLTIKVVENTEKVVYMVLPVSGDDQLSDIELERVVAGSRVNTEFCAPVGTAGPTCATVCT